MSENSNNTYSSSYKARHIGNYLEHMNIRASKGLKAHWITFIAVNVFLFIVNISIGYQYPWHFFPLLSWGIGIVIHTSVVFIKQRYRGGSDRGFFIHFAVFLTISGYLAGINILTSPYYLWFLWPVSALGIGIAMHFVAYQKVKIFERGQPIHPLYTLWYPGVVCFYLIFIDWYSSGWLQWFWWPCIPIMLISYAIVNGISQGKKSNRKYHAKRHYEKPTQDYKIIQKPDTQVNELNFCPQCGERNLQNHSFCEFCGLKLR